jgi:glycosyltransferase involved in cell wall biosynthesis
MPDARMRVLHIGKFYPPYPGGIERYCSELSAAQHRHGHDVAVLAHCEPGTWRNRQFASDGVEIALAACPGQLLYAPFSPAFPFLLTWMIRTFRPDLLHLHVPNTSAFWALLSPAARRLPWIVHWHADIPLDNTRHGLRLAYRVYRPWEQALLRHASAIIATSPPYLDASPALRPWRAKARSVALGITAESAALKAGGAAPLPGDGVRLLAVGRLSYYKGFDVLLRALVHVPQAQLLLIGEGECATSLRDLARKLGVDQRVRFGGHVDDAALAAAYAQADIFCLPSLDRAEAFGLVLLEAMRAGLPTIASDVPGSGIGFVVRNRETGLLVQRGDPAALASAIAELAANADLRRRYGQAGRQRWCDEFTLERNAEQVQAIYAELLQTSPRRATAASEK